MAHRLLPAFELKQTKRRESLAGISEEKCACCGCSAGHPDAVFTRSIDIAGFQKLMSLYPWAFVSTEAEDDERRRIDLYNALNEITNSFPDLISGIHAVQNPQSLLPASYLQHGTTTLATAQQLATVQSVQTLPVNSRFQREHVTTHGQPINYPFKPIKLHTHQLESSLPPSDDYFMVPSSDTLCSSPLHVITKVEA